VPSESSEFHHVHQIPRLFRALVATSPGVEILLVDVEEGGVDAPPGWNSLTAALYNAACESESLEDEVIESIHIEQFRERLPTLMKRLTDLERKAVRLKYFQDYTGTRIAEALGVSRGRVSQILKAALGKLKAAYERQHAYEPV